MPESPGDELAQQRIQSNRGIQRDGLRGTHALPHAHEVPVNDLLLGGMPTHEGGDDPPRWHSYLKTHHGAPDDDGKGSQTRVLYAPAKAEDNGEPSSTAWQQLGMPLSNACAV